MTEDQKIPHLYFTIIEVFHLGLDNKIVFHGTRGIYKIAGLSFIEIREIFEALYFIALFILDR